MSQDVDRHEFDQSRSLEYRSRADFSKLAILVAVADPNSEVTIRAPFGDEVMKGDFYIVASESGSYGAARAEFEAYHREVEPHRWVKHTTVLAYQADASCRIDTVLADGTAETSVIAQLGDWILRHDAGEVTVCHPEEFAKRYEPLA